MGELDPCPFAIEAGERIVRSLRANLFFTAGWEQIDRGVGKAYFERLFTEIVKDAYRRSQPANEPLTLEQLREMDGEPVWIKNGAFWALVNAAGQNVLLVENIGEIAKADGWMKHMGNIYRRPPERSENDA